MTPFRPAMLIVLPLLAVACGPAQREREGVVDVGQAKQTLKVVNRALVDRDREYIEAYIEIQGLQGVQENGAGLFYLIWGDGAGEPVRIGQRVSLEYRLWLLDGTLCYSSDSLGLKEFEVGRGGVESGLEMGVQLMRPGQHAKLILPPHLGHGLLGDGDRIPPRATIVYQVHLVSVAEN